jgi:hypothetical protein
MQFWRALVAKVVVAFIYPRNRIMPIAKKKIWLATGKMKRLKTLPMLKKVGNLLSRRYTFIPVPYVG